VDYFKREMLDASLHMAQDIMVFLGKDEAEMRYKAEQFRKHDEASLYKSFDFFENEPALMSFARTQRAELEQILREDVRDTPVK
jgi:CPA2 family monovalent cation:H+ antiporter-2